MKKIVLILLLIVLLILGVIYTILFTKIGNSYIASYIENSFNNKQNDFKLKFEEFTITLNDVKILADINSSSKIKIDGKINSLINQKADFSYVIDIKDLSIFSNLAKRELKGKIVTKGDFITNNKISTIIGEATLANSFTKYEINLNNFDINSINFDLKQANIDELLAIINEPIYTIGKLDLKCDLSSKNGSLSGDIFTKINEAKIVNETILNKFNFPIKQRITYNLNSQNKIENGKILSSAKLSSNLANLDLNSLVFDLEKEELSTDYILDILNLEKLEEFTKVLLKGDLKIAGNLNKTQNILKIDGKSNIADGQANFELKNDNLSFNLKNANSLKFLYMLNKDEFFSSIISLNLDYNLLSKQGKSLINLSNGHFVKNSFIQTIESLTKLDLSKEIFQTGVINSKIDNQKIVSNLNLESKNSYIKSQNSFIDLEKSKIDTKLDLNLNKNIFSVKLEDDLNKPKITVDVQELIKNVFEKKLDKYLDKKGDSETKELLKGIKSLF